MSWYGIHFRREREDMANVAKLERFKTNSLGTGFNLWLDFSASPLKPHDSDMEIVAKLSQLETLNLSGRRLRTLASKN